MIKSGIYGIFNLLNGKVYIGSTVNINLRFSQHKSELISKKHANARLQNAWNKYGAEAFEFTAFEYCDKQELLKHEQFYIDSLKSYHAEFGYNICPTAKSNLGRKFSDDYRKMKSIKAKQMMTPERRAKISKTLTGRIGWKHTKESKKKLSEAHKGKILSEETKEKLSIINTGKKLSEECKRKMSLRLKGHKGATHTKEFRQRLSILTLKRMSERFKNPEERKRQSESTRLWWQKRKQKLLIGG